MYLDNADWLPGHVVRRVRQEGEKEDGGPVPARKM